MTASPARYEIRWRGALGEQWSARFVGLPVAAEGTDTVIYGVVPGQPALYGLLNRVRSLGRA